MGCAMGVMSMVLMVVGVYGAIGLVVGAAFVVWGVGRVDPVARESGWGFRVVILPGAAALWPLVARKWIRAGRGGVRP